MNIRNPIGSPASGDRLPLAFGFTTVLADMDVRINPAHPVEWDEMVLVIGTVLAGQLD